MNYSTLVNTIKAYTENTFPETAGSDSLTTANQIATFVKQAEQRIYNSVQLPVLRTDGTMSCVADTATVSTPSGFLAANELYVTSGTTVSYLLNKDVGFIREAFPTTTTRGLPAYYALQDNDTLLLGPTPDSNYTINISFFKAPESIVTASTTWLGDNFDSVLLYGSLLEAYTFMKGEADILAEYQKRYDEALAMLKQFAEGKNRQDMYRTAQVRYPVR